MCQFKLINNRYFISYSFRTLPPLEFTFITIFTYSLIFTQGSFKLFVELNYRRHLQKPGCFKEIVS